MIELTTEKIIKIHDILIEIDKGTDEYSPGVRDIGTLENFVYYQLNNNNNVFKNAAFALHSITHRHAFYNANKRTGFGIASIILESERYFVNAKIQERLEYLLKIAQYETTVEEIEGWLISNTRRMGKLQFKLHSIQNEASISILSLVLKMLRL
jgi:death-on-curing protein